MFSTEFFNILHLFKTIVVKWHCFIGQRGWQQPYPTCFIVKIHKGSGEWTVWVLTLVTCWAERTHRKPPCKKEKKEISFSSEDRAVLRGGYLHQFSSEIFVCFLIKETSEPAELLIQAEKPRRAAHHKWLPCLAKRLQLSSNNLSRRSSRRSLHQLQLLLLQLRLQMLLHRRSLRGAYPQPRRSASPSGLWSSPGTAGMTKWSCRWRRSLSRSWRRERSWCGSRRAGWTSPSCWADRGCTSCCPPRRSWWEWRAPGSSRRSGRMWRTGKWVKGPAECAHIPTHTPAQH